MPAMITLELPYDPAIAVAPGRAPARSPRRSSANSGRVTPPAISARVEPGVHAMLLAACRFPLA